MATGSTSRSQRVVTGVVAAVVLVFVAAGAATQGVAGVLIMAGLAAGLVGLRAAIAGGARWAVISTRRIGGGAAGGRAPPPPPGGPAPPPPGGGGAPPR